MAGVFQTRGATALVYRGEDGIDKLTTTGNSKVLEVSRGHLVEYTINSGELGLAKAAPEDILGEGPEHNAELARKVLAGEPGPVRDIVVLNAAAGLVSFALAEDPAQQGRSLFERLQEKITVASATLDSGAAARKLAEWVEATHS
jgi:anthranilate phosphoribosyltransferase